LTRIRIRIWGLGFEEVSRGEETRKGWIKTKERDGVIRLSTGVKNQLQNDVVLNSR
jgi:hypothetical protein